MKKWILRILLVLIGLPLAVVVFVGAAFLISNRTNGSLITSGERRRYLLYVPKSYNPNKPTPLVITLHGWAEWPAHQMQESHWNDLADRYGFILVFPEGSSFPLRWRASGDDPSKDVQFMSDLIDKLEGSYNIDKSRIYANGLSNGGGMTFILSCQMADRIAAVGIVSGALSYPADQCHPARPVPTILFHGTDDPLVPYHGGATDRYQPAFPDIPKWVDGLAKRSGCTGSQDLPPQGSVTGVSYTGCQADVVFYTVHGGGHAWPGGEVLPTWIVGHTTQDINATEVMWTFFQQHPLPAK